MSDFGLHIHNGSTCGLNVSLFNTHTDARSCACGSRCESDTFRGATYSNPLATTNFRNHLNLNRNEMTHFFCIYNFTFDLFVAINFFLAVSKLEQSLFLMTFYNFFAVRSLYLFLFDLVDYFSLSIYSGI